MTEPLHESNTQGISKPYAVFDGHLLGHLMKLLLCRYCSDVFALQKERRSCRCERCTGLYLDDVQIEVMGPCYVLAVNNRVLVKTLDHFNEHKASIPDKWPLDVLLVREPHPHVQRHK